MGSKTPSVASSSPPRVIKKENDDNIKDFAETAMNELLGWYGYERLELRRWAASRTSPDSSNTPDPKDKDECSWCNNPITTDNGALHQSGAKFCSELCFSQSRRATFKRAKTCDWCRHVRHTVAYVDFQDGATQLQFCSDKCLNQYKMHIFCRETQAHLDLNPHLVNASSSSNLITPELWLKNCKSRSTSPKSERSASPTAENLALGKMGTITTSTEKIEPVTSTANTQRKSPLPVITIAPTSKLMKPKTIEDNLIRKSPEQRKESKSSKFNFRKRRSSRCTSTVTSQSLAKQNANTKLQDMRLCSPPSTRDTSSPGSSTMGNSTMHSPPLPMNPLSGTNIHPTVPNAMFGMPPPMFMDGIPPNQTDPRFPKGFHPPNFLPRSGMFHPEHPRFPPPFQFPQAGMGQPPPVTILVPYPVILPMPIPIPIPLPMTSFLQAHNATKKTKADINQDDMEVPLDFTMNGDKKKESEESVQLQEPDKQDLNQENMFDVTSRLTESEANKKVGDESSPESPNPEHTLPKFKITRLGNKMAKIVTKPRENSDSTRPLRKRKRLVELPTEEDSPMMPKSRKIVQV